MADIQVNLLHKGDRKLQSHDMPKMRPQIQKIAKNMAQCRSSTRTSVLSTLVAEVYDRIIRANKVAKQVAIFCIKQMVL
jgi:hypothetical protein